MHELIFVAVIVLFLLLLVIMCSKPAKKELEGKDFSFEPKHGDSVWSGMTQQTPPSVSSMSSMSTVIPGMTGVTGITLNVIMITRDDTDLSEFMNGKMKAYTDNRGIDVIYTTNQKKGMNKIAKVINMKNKELKSVDILAENGVTLVTVDYRYVGTMMRELGHNIKELDPENTCRVYVIKGDKLIIGCQSENLTCQK